MPKPRSSFVTYSQQVVDALKRMLLTGELAAGDRVNEVHIATALGISRAPVRDALHMLSNEGLIEVRPQKGKFIPILTKEFIENSYFVGGVLEGAAAATAQFTEKDFALMQSIVEAMKDAAKNGASMDAFAPLDTQFHQVIFNRCANPLLEELSRRSCLRISKFLLFRHWQTVYTPEEVVARHHEVLHCLIGRLPEHIEASLRAHYRETGVRYAALLDGNSS